MKILVIQLARLGDIYMTWPVIRALKRVNPAAQVDLLVRNRFKGATVGLAEVDRVLEFNTQHILDSLFEDKQDLNSSLEKMSQVANTLHMQRYDRIINLSFSPFSSFLTHAIAHSKAHVSGYSRHADGYLHIPDDGSSYFYAQVGMNRFNRIHITDLFSNVAGVDYVDADFAPPVLDSQLNINLENTVIVHVGASQKFKMLDSHKWAQIINKMYAQNTKYKFALIGSADEQAYAETIESSVSKAPIVNLIGKTNLQDIFKLLSKAELLIGCDSAPMHMATLVNCPTLCVSFQTVNFWETGPRSERSYVAFYPQAEGVDADFVAQQALHILNQEELSEVIFKYTKGYPCYTRAKDHSAFEWDLIQSIYLSQPLPQIENKIQLEGFQRLREINSVIQEQIENIRQTGRVKELSGLIQRGDEIVQVIGQLVPEICPLIRWYQTEKIRIPPLHLSSIMDETEKIHKQLDVWLDYYLGPQVGSIKSVLGSVQHYQELIYKTEQQVLMLCTELRFSGIKMAAEQLTKVIDLSMSLVNGLSQLRDNLASILDKFDAHTWNFNENELHGVIFKVEENMIKSDYNLVADCLEHDLIGCLDNWITVLKNNEEQLNYQVERSVQEGNGAA